MKHRREVKTLKDAFGAARWKERDAARAAPGPRVRRGAAAAHGHPAAALRHAERGGPDGE